MAAKLIRLTHKNSDKTAPSGRELYNLQFSLQVASPVIFGIHPRTLIFKLTTEQSPSLEADSSSGKR
jgi:hypothetical protein